ncbi:MAG: amidohydrolase family protein [Saprospiraceae bacterium]|nr:amidohydrolase family protein [Saprospiraceae bacterium]
MNRPFIFLLFFFSSAGGLYAQIADRAFVNGKIYTADDDQPYAEALAISGELIVYVGSDAGVQAHIGTATVVEDLEGRLILPGLHDVHMHPLEAGTPAWGDCLLDPYEWFTDDLVDALVDCNPQPNSNGWILAYGHSIFTLLEDGTVPRFALDAAFPDVPVAVGEETSHSLWVNSKALEVAGIDATTPDPEGGHIIRHPGNGQPIGILLDNAGDLVLHQALASTPEIDAQNLYGLLNYSLPLMAENGITSACEARTYLLRNYVDTWQTVRDSGLLTCRMILQPWIHPELDDPGQIATLVDLYADDDPMLRINQVKVYADGITINATAALHEPYDYYWGLPFDTGLNYIEVNRLSNLIATLEPLGYDFHIHAIGDRGATEGLDAVAFARTQNGDLGARHRITHLEIVDEADYPRFADLNVTADLQVSGWWTEPQHWDENIDFVGPDRSDAIIPLKDLENAGARITLSSDWDVSTLNPFRGIQNALSRAPQQISSREAAVKAYTINGAYVMRQEASTGSLEVGKWADFICVDQDIFTVPVNQIALTKVLSTWVGGVEVWRSDELPVISRLEEALVAEDQLRLFPNPASDFLTVECPGQQIRRIDLFASNGEWVWSVNGGNSAQVTFTSERLPSGSYFLRARLADGRARVRPFVRP